MTTTFRMMAVTWKTGYGSGKVVGAGVVAERAFAMLRLLKRACRVLAQRRRINLAFDDKVGVGKIILSGRSKNRKK